MLPREVIEFFSTFTKLPILVNDVVAQLVEGGVQDRIRFVGVQIDTGVIRGKIVRYTRPGSQPYSEPMLCTDIYYDNQQPIEWRRLVCVKELMHILDRDSAQTRTKADVSHLVERVVIPADLQTDGLQVSVDRLADLQALAILLPIEARDALMDRFKAGLITVKDVARLAAIPERYVPYVMSDDWDALYRAILEL